MIDGLSHVGIIAWVSFVAMRFHLFIFVLVLLNTPAFGQDGFVQYRYENGVVSSEGTMRQGKPDGYWKTYYPDGSIKTEGNRKNFQLDSTWIFYRSNKSVERIITYREGIKNGLESTFDENGKRLEDCLLENGIRNSQAKRYYPEGPLRQILIYENNKEEGRSTEYDRDGRIITEYVYRNGFVYSEERINRYDINAKRTGVWRDLFPNGQLKEEGMWLNGLRNGVFKFFDDKGKLLKLEKYEDGLLVIDEAATAMLDIRKEFYPSGKVHLEGTYRDGKRQGNFREYDEQGNEIGGQLYDGDIKIGEGRIDSLGRRVGAWKLFHPNGVTKAVGNYVNGKRDGAWVYFYENGKTEQKGSFKEDILTGQWTWYFPNGGVQRDESYRKGKQDGHFAEYDSLGNPINEGDYLDGLKNGNWKLHVNDHTEQGEYQDGERNGVWVWYYGNGQKSFEGEYQAGAAVGKHKYWHDNGQVSETGGYQAGERHGRWDYYDRNGMQELQLEYEEGVVYRINGKKIKLPEAEE